MAQTENWEGGGGGGGGGGMCPSAPPFLCLWFWIEIMSTDVLSGVALVQFSTIQFLFTQWNNDQAEVY